MARGRAARTSRSARSRAGLALHVAGLKLLRGAALALGLSEDTLRRAVRERPARVRACCTTCRSRAEQMNTGILWGEEHTDFNLLTLLPGWALPRPRGQGRAARPTTRAGLYLRTRADARAPRRAAGARHARRPAASSRRWASSWRSSAAAPSSRRPHVITAPRHARLARSVRRALRAPAHQHGALPAPALRTAEAVRAYAPPVLAGTYAIKTLVDIGLAPPSALDQLGYRHYDRLDAQRAQR